jgi:hypothetical protein
MDHDLFGPILREGIATGQVQGERTLVQKQMVRRFGALPEWVTQRVGQLGTDELEDLGVRAIRRTKSGRSLQGSVIHQLRAAQL